ncbi:aminotransferase class I/II-fold pyridoxal phosphate-dependent enzyme [Clostridium estertheticum]|uniref:pyridoxal phosphate-dependent aminotransferase n=1 Tax=Clostridium estertheticum TaxID=238834 RepID=UPI0013E959A7|nr:aminotransferase class I/II-fold pyridoxal phosphate-dependent enzyme [Clostridium estertheticum]MBZ9687866.1 aminotransferase class I/II-fold pyridoxal phosphate-dependent enzyme [Clostridium estertheticum]
MNKPILSNHFKKRMPSDVRLGQMKFGERKVKPALVNVAIGNVSLPTNPAMQKRMFSLDAPESPFAKGVVRYSGTAGVAEAQDAFKNILKCQGFDTSKLFVQVTDGGSSGMELLLLGVCGAAGTDDKPLMMIDPAYTNYISFAERIGRKTVTVKRHLGEDGKFSLPELDKIEETIKKHNPGALLVIPYDNPTGQLYDYATLKALAKICVKYNMWMISDEAYRGLFYVDGDLVSIWGITDADVPGIEGRRISLDTASKVWSACGLRIGALITDSEEFHTQSVAEYTANLCANVIGQYIFGALAHESKQQIDGWCKDIREYYKKIMFKFYNGMKELDPGLIVSSPDSSIYSVVDVRNVVKPGFDSINFVMYCAQEGSVDLSGVETTLLVAPMKGFYDLKPDEFNPGSTQMRIAFVETPENMEKVPELFVKLLRKYEEAR